MTTNNPIQMIMSLIVDSHSYDRMQSSDCTGVDDTLSYAAFLEWNNKCIRELSDEDLNWLVGLTNYINKDKIRLMDLESCALFSACAIYFDQKKRLCIVNPR